MFPLFYAVSNVETTDIHSTLFMDVLGTKAVATDGAAASPRMLIIVNFMVVADGCYLWKGRFNGPAVE
jgi:hypothetical protein